MTDTLCQSAGFVPSHKQCPLGKKISFRYFIAFNGMDSNLFNFFLFIKKWNFVILFWENMVTCWVLFRVLFLSLKRISNLDSSQELIVTHLKERKNEKDLSKKTRNKMQMPLEKKYNKFFHSHTLELIIQYLARLNIHLVEERYNK